MTEFSFFSRSAGLSVAEIASLTGAEPSAGADLSRRLTGIGPVDCAGANDLTFVKDAKFAHALAATGAGAVLTSDALRRPGARRRSGAERARAL